MGAMPPVERQAPGAAQLATDVAYWLLGAQDSPVAAQSRLTWHVHWHGLPLRKSRGTSAGLATTAALTAAALATTRLEGWLRHRTNRTRSRARVRATRVDGPKVRFTKRALRNTGTAPLPPPPPRLPARLSLRRARLHLLALWQSNLEDRNIAKKRCGSIGCGKGWEEVNYTGTHAAQKHGEGNSLLKRTDGDSRYLPSPRASHVQCSRTCQLVHVHVAFPRATCTCSLERLGLRARPRGQAKRSG